MYGKRNVKMAMTGKEHQMEEIILETEHLCFSYEEGKEALSDINVCIRAGERIAVLGENGAGKSTFFLNLNGVRCPDAGVIKYKGQPVGKKERRLLQQKVGIVFQNADDQIIASTVKAEIAFGPLNMGMSREDTERSVEHAIEQMHLKGYEMRPPHYLSGGEKKRVAIADILAMDAPVILFDEPTAALDPVSAEMLEEVLTALEQQNCTVLLSTHDIDFAYRFAERILVFSKGRLIADGTPEEIFSRAEILAEANLKKPTLMEVCQFLEREGIFSEHHVAPERRHPRRIEELYTAFSQNTE